MKLTCEKSLLQEAITGAEKITAKNPSLPVLKSVILEAGSKGVVVRATNLEIGVEFQLPAKIITKGLVAINGALVANYLQNLSGSEELTLEQTGSNLAFISPHATGHLNLLPADDFPTIPKVTTGPELSLDAKVFVAALHSVIYAAANSDIKPEIASVYLHQDGRDLVLVATDSFRLAERRLINVFSTEGDFGAIIPHKNAADISRIIEGLSGPLTIRLDKHQVSILGETVYLTSRIIDGVYPNYRQIIPRTTTTTVTLNKNELLQALRLVSVLADRFYQVDCTLSAPDRFELVSHNQEAGETTVQLTATVAGDDLALSFNARYLLESLQSINSEAVVIKLTERNKPILITGVGVGDFTYLVMPVNR